jgi:hypothetical protein
MLSGTIITKLAIFGFMVLVGGSMAANIQARNTPGLLLSLVSLVAGIYVIHLLEKLKQGDGREGSN